MQITKNFSKSEFDCYLYHIKKDGMSLNDGYVGVSVDVEKRISRHFNSMIENTHYNPVLSRAYRKYDLQVEVVCGGTIKEMLDLEFKLRPKKFIGWNIATGGGLPPSNKGVAMSEEQKIKISKSNKGKINSEEHKKKAVAKRRMNKSYNGQNAKVIQMLDFNTLKVLNEFNSAKLAAEHFGSKVQGNISAVCRGERNIAMGYKWKYKEI